MKDTRNSAELLRLATVNYCAQTVLALLCLFEIWNDVCTYRLNTEHFLLLVLHRMGFRGIDRFIYNLKHDQSRTRWRAQPNSYVKCDTESCICADSMRSARLLHSITYIPRYIPVDVGP